MFARLQGSKLFPSANNGIKYVLPFIAAAALAVASMAFAQSAEPAPKQAPVAEPKSPEPVAPSPPSESAAPAPTSEAADAGAPAPQPAEPSALVTAPSIVNPAAGPSRPEKGPEPEESPRDISEVKAAAKQDLKGYQLMPGEAASVSRPRNVCAVGYPAGTRPFGDEPWGPRARVGAEAGLAAKSYQGQSGLWLSPELNVWFRAIKMVAVSADWGFSYLNLSPDRGAARNVFRPGNPFLALHSVRRHGCTELRIGLGATLPLARLTLADANLDYLTYYGAMAIRGMSDWWLWAPDSMTIAIPISWESVLDDRWSWGGSVAMASTAVLPRRPAASLEFLTEEPRRAHLIIPLSAHFGYRIGSFVVGSYVHDILIITGKGEMQASVSPYARWERGSGWLEGRFTANLDKPLGIIFTKEGFWGARLAGGIGF